jgi:hypothetical protein
LFHEHLISVQVFRIPQFEFIPNLRMLQKVRAHVRFCVSFVVAENKYRSKRRVGPVMTEVHRHARDIKMVRRSRHNLAWEPQDNTTSSSMNK